VRSVFNGVSYVKRFQPISIRSEKSKNAPKSTKLTGVALNAIAINLMPILVLTTPQVEGS
jgi:hypothetical protein